MALSGTTRGIGVKWILRGAVIGLLCACATTLPTKPKPMPSMPAAWSEDIDLSNTKCTPISGQFDNLGEHYLDAKGEGQDGHLAEDVFARILPQSEPARVVIMHSDPATDHLLAEVIGRASRKIAIEISCDAGWHTFSFERSGTYVGGGMEEEHFRQVAYLREDGKGRLVARIATVAEFISDAGSASKASGENWYRFERYAGS